MTALGASAETMAQQAHEELMLGREVLERDQLGVSVATPHHPQ
jgi:hypothetical protein